MGFQSASSPCAWVSQKLPLFTLNVQRSTDRKMSEQYGFPLPGPHGAAGRRPRSEVAAAVGLLLQRNGEEPTAGARAKWVSRDLSQRETESTGVCKD